MLLAFLGNIVFGETSFGETSLLAFGGNIVWGNVVRGNVIWGNIIRGNIVWGIAVVLRICKKYDIENSTQGFQIFVKKIAQIVCT
jgi:ribosomal protein L35AE/L33A